MGKLRIAQSAAQSGLDTAPASWGDVHCIRSAPTGPAVVDTTEPKDLAATARTRFRILEWNTPTALRLEHYSHSIAARLQTERLYGVEREFMYAFTSWDVR